jgi:acetyl esterase/lipase
MRRFLSLLLVSMGLATAPGCAPSPGPSTRIPPLSSGPQTAAGLPVCEVAGETLRGDLVRPDRTTHKRRALLFVHGGGWRGGAREDFAPLMHALAGQGYTGLTVDYRLSPAVRHPEHLADVKCALRWLKAHASELDIDPDRIALLGGSAGGHLAALAAYTPNDPRFEGQGLPRGGDTRIAALVTHGAPTDLRDAARYSDETRRAVGVLMGRVPLSAAMLDEASPVHFARPDIPPTLILHGEHDPIVPVAQAQRLDAVLSAVNAPHRLHVIPGAGHADFGSDPDAVGRLLLQFLDTHVR